MRSIESMTELTDEDRRLWFEKQKKAQALDDARFALEEAALAYGRACDAGDYPRFHILIKALKLAARKMAWVDAGILDDPRPKTRAAKRKAKKEGGIL